MHASTYSAINILPQKRSSPHPYRSYRTVRKRQRVYADGEDGVEGEDEVDDKHGDGSEIIMRGPESKQDFVKDVTENAQDIVRHGLLILMCTFRLWSLPLVYAVRAISHMVEDHHRFTGLSSQYAARSWHASVSEQFAEIGARWSRVLKYTGDIISLPIRVTRTLCLICDALEQEPTLLHRGLVLEELLKQAIGSCGAHAPSGIVNAEAGSTIAPHGPASASEVYHAAIQHGATLDEVLAAFEVSDSSNSFIAETPQQETQELSDEKGELMSEDSIQPTPAEVLGLRRSSFMSTDLEHRLSSSIEPETIINPSTSVTPSSITAKEFCSQEKQGQAHLRPNVTPLFWSMPDIHADHTLKAPAASSDGMQRCQTCSKKHSKSRLLLQTMKSESHICSSADDKSSSTLSSSNFGNADGKKLRRRVRKRSSK